MARRGEWIGPETGGNPGRYQVIRILGQGGMGEVCLASDIHLDREVALKMVDFSALNGSAREDYIERFKREARTTARLDSPYVVRVYDYFVQADEGRAYLTMEVLRGQDLSSYLEQHGPVRQEGYSWLFGQIRYGLHGLATAHALDVVHRDIKPANLFLAEQSDGSTILKVLDFGIARVSGENVKQLTVPGAIFGTPDYMSPEQIQGLKVGPAGDIFSFGMAICEALTGRVPYSDWPDEVPKNSDPLPGALMLWQLQAMRGGVAAEMSRLSPNLPPYCAEFLGSMIELDPLRRPDAMTACNFFSNIARAPHLISPRGSNPTPEMKQFQQAVTADEPEAPVQIIPGKPPTLAAVTKDSKDKLVRRLPRMSLGQLLVVAAGMFVGIITVTAFIMRGTSEPRPDDAATTQPPTALVITHDASLPSADAVISPDAGMLLVVADAGSPEPVRPERYQDTPRPHRRVETSDERDARTLQHRLARQCCDGTGIPGVVGASHCPPAPGSSDYRRLRCGHH